MDKLARILDAVHPALPLGIVLAALVLSGVGSCVRYNTDGPVDYCYIRVVNVDHDNQASACLYGHQPWRSNAFLGCWNTIEAALDAAHKLSCPLDGAAGGK
jgi:hypothetical protein